jgi:hypothetical protein
MRWTYTNWDDFRHLINKRLTINVSLKTEEDIEEADEFFKDTMPKYTETLKANGCPILIKQRDGLAPTMKTQKQKIT